MSLYRTAKPTRSIIWVALTADLGRQHYSRREDLPNNGVALIKTLSEVRLVRVSIGEKAKAERNPGHVRKGMEGLKSDDFIY